MAGRSYRLRIRPEEEQVIRKAVKQADEKILEMRNAYAGKDEQDFMAMVLLSYAADTAVDAIAHPVIKEGADRMIERIEKALAEE